MTGERLHRFIGGRRRYNLERQVKAIDRRYKVLATWSQNPHWSQARLAEHLGISKPTLCRDIKWLRNLDNSGICPLCNQTMKSESELSKLLLINDYVRSLNK